MAKTLHITRKGETKTLKQWGVYFNKRSHQLSYTCQKVGGDWIKALDLIESESIKAKEGGQDSDRIAEIKRNNRMFYMAMNALPAHKMVCNSRLM